MTTMQGPIVAGPVVLTGDWLRVALQAVLTPTPTLLRHAETRPLNQQRPCNPPYAPLDDEVERRELDRARPRPQVHIHVHARAHRVDACASHGTGQMSNAVTAEAPC